MPLWIELLVSLLIVYGGVLALSIAALRGWRKATVMRRRRDRAAQRKQEETS